MCCLLLMLWHCRWWLTNNDNGWTDRVSATAAATQTDNDADSDDDDDFNCNRDWQLSLTSWEILLAFPPPYAIAVSKCVYFSPHSPHTISLSLVPFSRLLFFTTFYLIWFYGPARSWESGKCGYTTPILIKIEQRCKMRMDNYYLFKRVLKITITILDLFLEMLILCPFTSGILFYGLE